MCVLAVMRFTKQHSTQVRILMSLDEFFAFSICKAGIHVQLMAVLPCFEYGSPKP